jgi:hypothetical protein
MCVGYRRDKTEDCDHIVTLENESEGKILNVLNYLN